MKYFGTDGFRGCVGKQLHALHAFQIGRYLGYYFSQKHSSTKARVIIGKDTRISGDVLEHALASGAASSGCDVYFLGVCPTPAVSYLVRTEKYDFGVMISASHNAYMDNGIKVFNASGFKLDEEIEVLVEQYIDGEISIDWAPVDNLGRMYDVHKSGLESYATWLTSLFDTNFAGMKVALDLANGSATAIAAEVIRNMQAEVTVLSNEPDGFNINLDCGSTHLGKLKQFMRNHPDYTVGLAFDGDADRLLAVDEHGNAIDGDVIMYLCAKHLKQRGQLKQDTLVTTVMSNIGLYKALENAGIRSEIVQVGDKYVSQCMFASGYSLGGEQSGHIIFGEESVTGDGLLSALHLLEVIAHSDKTMSELAKEVTIYPQLLKNVKVKDKRAALQDQDVVAQIQKVEQLLVSDGRILVRPSGTEQLIRVMVEAKSHELCDNCVRSVTEILENKAL